MMSAEHQCMSARGVRQQHVAVVTSRFLGRFETDASLRDRFIAMVNAQH
jgi:GTP cyclohydrolase I